MLGASIVGVVGAAVAVTVLALGPQVGSDSVASRDPDTGTATSATPSTPPDDTLPLATDPPATDPPDTSVAATEPPDASTTTVAPTTVAPTTVAPTTTVVPEPTFEFADSSTCPAAGHAAVVDRENQRAWLCGEGLVTNEMLMTSAWIQPDPGDYAVYAKDMNSSSRFTGRYSTMTHFVAFTHGKIRGARIAFHSMPI